MKRLRIYAGILTGSMLIALSAINAFADGNYTIGSAYWNYDESMGAVAEWDETEDKTAYKVQLYRSDKTVGSAKSASREKYNFTSDIISKGTGTYHFVVWSTKGGKESTMAISDTLYVSSSDDADISISDLKKSKTKSGMSSDTGSSSAAGTGKGPGITGGGPGAGPGVGWHQEVNTGRWQYLDSGRYISNCWKEIDGRWYFFGSDSYMMTGWQWIPGSDGVTRCYYLADGTNPSIPAGSCYMNCSTPDGYQVDGSGAWIINGIVQTR